MPTVHFVVDSHQSEVRESIGNVYHVVAHAQFELRIRRAEMEKIARKKRCRRHENHQRGQLSLQHDILLSDTFFRLAFLGAMLLNNNNFNELAITEIVAQIHADILFFST